MKRAINLMVFTLFIFILSAGCSKKLFNNTIYKGRLEIKGMCGHTTISILEGDIDPSKIEAYWTDSNTLKTYHNVFALGTPCNFPMEIKEGDEFYFKIESQPENCLICDAEYPAPSKYLPVKVTHLIK
jgi:hypothetical protein